MDGMWIWYAVHGRPFDVPLSSNWCGPSGAWSMPYISQKTLHPNSCATSQEPWCCDWWQRRGPSLSQWWRWWWRRWSCWCRRFAWESHHACQAGVWMYSPPDFPTNICYRSVSHPRWGRSSAWPAPKLGPPHWSYCCGFALVGGRSIASSNILLPSN